VVGRTKPLTPADRERFGQIKSMRCIACQVMRHFGCCGPTEAHHLLSGNKRIGHHATVPLGAYHHRAEPLPGFTVREMEASFGPSLKLSSKLFRERFGDDQELLRLTNEKLGASL
jgi:hypothetical protein